MPTRYLLDTNAVGRLARRDPIARVHTAGLTPSDTLWTCFVVVGEWEYGLNAAPSSAARARIAAAASPVFAALTGVWESSPEVAKMYGTVHPGLSEAGAVIPTNDVWIAAVALAHGATLVTSDPHFSRVPALQIADWAVP